MKQDYRSFPRAFISKSKNVGRRERRMRRIDSENTHVAVLRRGAGRREVKATSLSTLALGRISVSMSVIMKFYGRGSSR